MRGPFLFEWDDVNIDHIASHDYNPEQVEEVFAGPFHLHRGRAGRFIASGPTFEGRMTVVIFERFPGSRLRVITAREMSRRERRRYRHHKHDKEAQTRYPRSRV